MADTHAAVSRRMFGDPGSSRTGVLFSATHLPSAALESLGCMEGVYEPVVAPKPAAPHVAILRHGYIAALIVAAVAYGIHLLPLAPFSVTDAAGTRHPVSDAMIAILLGLLLRNAFTLPASIRAGCRHIVKRLVPLTIVLMGAGLDLNALLGVGARVLGIIVVCLVFAVAAGYAFGRWMGLSEKAALLLGAGTGICGNSAIVAVAPLVDAEDNDVLLSIGTVNFFGLVAMLALPILGRALSMGGEMFGVWCGTSIHAVPQVVAAGFALDPHAGAVATLVKLVRVTMLAPLVFVLALIHTRRIGAAAASQDGFVVRYARLVPWFVWGFVVMAALNTLGWIPTLQFPERELFKSILAPSTTSLVDLMTTAGKVILTLAMAAIGLDVSIRDLTGVGARAMLAGLASTASLVLLSLLLITMAL